MNAVVLVVKVVAMAVAVVLEVEAGADVGTEAY